MEIDDMFDDEEDRAQFTKPCAIEAEVRAEAQGPVALPIPPAGIITHQNLGELYDRLQMQQYAMKYADITAQQMPAPCPGCVELESKWLSEQARNLAEEADYEHMSIDVFAMQAKVAELEQQRQQWLDADLCGMVVRDQERTITEQAALIDKCEKDAARYQYFRSSAAAAMYLNSTDEKLDFAIDAAIAAQKS